MRPVIMPRLYHMTRKFGPIKVVDIVIVSDRNASLSLEPGGWQLATPVCEVCVKSRTQCVWRVYVALVKYNAEIAADFPSD